MIRYVSYVYSQNILLWVVYSLSIFTAPVYKHIAMALFKNNLCVHSKTSEDLFWHKNLDCTS